MPKEHKIVDGYVRDTDTGEYLIQKKEDNRWGFSLFDDEMSYPGGFGKSSNWECVSEDDVPSTIVDSLGWILD